ncbi:MAG TPA: DNA-directed RNA polymerase subunit K [Candidatus Nanoarchaeia archaeon]|nr:DNA-directed RNA polymerase subunit K [Candidatus Nanoarchaeia archaeon]
MKYTKYEKARLIGARALQLSMGAPFLIKMEEYDLEKINYNPIEIAKLELEKGLLPITIRRPSPKKTE